jgi:hypothetical protein
MGRAMWNCRYPAWAASAACLIAAALSLSGCAQYREYLAAKDDAKCVSYGAAQGDPSYVQCRATLDAARTTASAVGSSVTVINRR